MPGKWVERTGLHERIFHAHKCFSPRKREANGLQALAVIVVMRVGGNN